MAKSLQEQLLKAGLVSTQQAKKAKTDKRKQSKLRNHQNALCVDENKQAVKQAQAEKAARDKLLNQQQQEQLAKKAAKAQIKQLIEANRLTEETDGDAYNFSDSGKLRTVYVTQTTREKICSGKLAIVKMNRKYYLVETIIAEKIAQINKIYVVLINAAQKQAIAADDPYANYQVPDDLIW